MNRFFRLASVLALALCLCFPVSAFAVEFDEASESSSSDVADTAPDISDTSDSSDSSDTSPNTTTETLTTETDGNNITVNVTLPASESSVSSGEEEEEGNLLLQKEMEETPSYTSYATRTLDDVETSDNETTLPGVVTSLFGTYTPRTQTVTEFLSDGSTVSYTEVVPGVAGLDWPWITSVSLFAMVLYCVFRLIGGFFKWN